MKKIIGHVGVDSGQLLITDPCYLKEFKNNEYTGKRKKKDYSYAGCAEVTLSKNCGGNFKDEKYKQIGVAVGSGLGDGVYPVEAIYEDGIVKEVNIKFF